MKISCLHSGVVISDRWTGLVWSLTSSTTSWWLRQWSPGALVPPPGDHWSKPLPIVWLLLGQNTFCWRELFGCHSMYKHPSGNG